MVECKDKCGETKKPAAAGLLLKSTSISRACTYTQRYELRDFIILVLLHIYFHPIHQKLQLE
jgi:hypothetical protein